MRAPRLAGRRIFVTGAASGIGAAIATLFAAEGARVALADRQPIEQLPNAQACSFSLDVTHEQAVRRAVDDAAQAFDGLDGVVNAAGIANTDLLAELSVQDWRRVIEVNLTGTFLVCAAAERHLRGSAHPTIVNFSSGQGLQPFARRGAYAASKAGVISLTKTLALEWAPIRANTICPGAVDTPMVRQGYGDEARAQIGARYALGRIGEPVEMALAALYLSSRESSFVTGIVLAVDGGRSFH
ncbi:MAG: SDR family oxidoreductase [Proteobacteria bacterium]|nr:SDR family oxidoreductase [Pseudomonadota bacterium]